MLYFSELKNKDVCTEDNIKIGTLEDLIFSATEIPTISKLVIEDLTKNKINIPVEYLKKIGDCLIIRKIYSIGELEENELYLLRNIQDKQIIDLQGNKIVRVNDVAIQDKAGLYISGVDIGVFGILRWLKLEDFFNKILSIIRLKPVSQFLSWADIQPLELARGQVRLRKEEKRLEKLRPEDLADYLDKTNIVNVRKILKMLDEKFAAQVIGSLNINFRTALFKQFASEKAAKIISYIDPDEAVDALLTLSSKKRNEVISFLSDKKKDEFNHLIRLSTTPIGNLLTTEFVTVNPESLVREVLGKIKNTTGDFSYLYHIYVVNKQEELIGIFNLHELLLQNYDTPVYRFMIQNVIVIHLTTPGHIALNKLIKYKFGALPVIDKDNHILGIITLLDVMNAFNRR